MIRFSYEKRGGGAITKAMRQFAEFEDKYRLVEHFMEGAMYTWSNNQDNVVMTKLDRFLMSVDREIVVGCSKQQAICQSAHRIIEPYFLIRPRQKEN
ncbi:hypothetical protein FRX31_024230 [Thalictrum thalictroides]|uniref:Uncharacterized protein n=1 Tax=Thalictrum thalictroides TaxID=46969 RepID=A0A7J6VMN6_THATH|nr:hypothetical protein FRX31_024230 [Thalictrum thalictroides]